MKVVKRFSVFMRSKHYPCIHKSRYWSTFWDRWIHSAPSHQIRWTFIYKCSSHLLLSLTSGFPTISPVFSVPTCSQCFLIKALKKVKKTFKATYKDLLKNSKYASVITAAPQPCLRYCKIVRRWTSKINLWKIITDPHVSRRPQWKWLRLKLEQFPIF